MGLYDFFSKSKKKIGDTMSFLGATASGYADSLKKTLNAPAPKVLQNTLGRLPQAENTFKPAYDFLSGINTRPLSSRASSPLGKLAGGIVETPYTFLTSVPKTYGQTMKEIGSKSIFTPGGVKRTAGRALESGLDTASMGLLGKGAQLAKAGAKSVAESVVTREAPKVGALIREGAKQGMKVGAGYGAGYGGAEALKEEKNVFDTSKDIVLGGATGALFGGAFGGGLPAAGAIGKAVKHDLSKKRVPTDSLPTRRVLEETTDKLYPAQRNSGLRSFKPQTIRGQSFKDIPLVPTTLREVGSAMPRFGMGIEDVSQKLPLVPSNKNTQRARAVNTAKNQTAAEAVAKMPRGVKPKPLDPKRIIPDEVFNTEAGGNVFNELSAAKAGERQWVSTPDEIGSSGKMIGIPSTFPQWVPEEYRRTALFKEVKDALLDATLPKSKPAQRLYDIIHNEIRQRSKLPLYNFDAYDAKRLASTKPILKTTQTQKTPVRDGIRIQNETPEERFVKSLDEIPTPWGDKAQAKFADDLGTMAPAGGYNKYQQKAFNEKRGRVRSIGEVLNAPRELRAAGYTKKEAVGMGVSEAETVAELAKLGYPKAKIERMDFGKRKLATQYKVPYSSLREYEKKKIALNTNILDGIDAEDFKDISPLQAGTRDVYRNFETVFGKNAQKVKQELLDPFDAAKGEFIAEQKQWLQKLDNEVVKGLGIKKGSKLSGLVQLYGEKKMTLDELKRAAPKDWEKVVKADGFFRNAYDGILDELNRVREFYFPTNPLYPESTKIIPKRADYYRHFREIQEGLPALKNIFDTPANIDPSLAVSSEFTKPGSKWLSFAQRRKGDATEMDAVGGFLDYLKSAMYAKHIDPHIQRFRGVDAEVASKQKKTDGFFDDSRVGLAEELSRKTDPILQIADTGDIETIKKILIGRGASEKQAEWMGKELADIKDADTVRAFLKEKLLEKFQKFEPSAEAEVSENKLNNFLKFLDNFANDLAGKTNPLDRPVQDNLFGRQAFRAINWLNSRVKANVILGNVSSAVAQFFGIPNGIANAGVRNSAKAVGTSLADIFRPNAPSKNSAFLNERYFMGYDDFDPGMIASAKKMAIWITSIGDKVGTKFTWNANYQKALSEGVSDPVKYADDWTRKMVAGRGIGEVPIMQKSKLIQIVAPFQLEVANQWRVFGDWARNDPKKLVFAKKMMEFSVAVWLMNRVAEELRGSGVALDPIQAMIDAMGEYQDSDTTGEGIVKSGGRLAGEALKNIPGGQTIAGLYDEYGGGWMGGAMEKIAGDTITREELFGKGDPTRFGSGLLVQKGLQDAPWKILPPFGGQQAKNMYEGTKTLLRGYAETAKGKVMTPVEQNARNIAQGLVFGKNALPEVREYYNADQTPLSEQQTEKFKLMGNEYYDSVMNDRAAAKEKKALSDGSDGKTAGIAQAAGDMEFPQLSDGSFFVKEIGKDGATFDTIEKARDAKGRYLLEKSSEDFLDMGDYVLKKEKKAGPGVSITALTPEEGKIEMTKAELKKSKESYFDDGEYVYLKAKNGDVTTKPKNEFTLDLNDKRMNFAKDMKDFETWRKHAEESFSLLNTMLENPALNEFDRLVLTDKKETLARDFAKYRSYGGSFTKGKKLEEKFRYPIIDKDMLKIQALLMGGGKSAKPRVSVRPLSLIPVRLPKVRRYRRRRK